jgi:hypothetical protein
MFIARRILHNVLRSLGAKSLFDEVENVLVLEGDVKLP